MKKPKQTKDNEWPIGMRPDGTLNAVTPPPGLTDDEISDWMDVHDDVEDEDAIV